MPIWIVALHFQNLHFDTICESWLFEITTFHTQNVFIQKSNCIMPPAMFAKIKQSLLGMKYILIWKF